MLLYRKSARPPFTRPVARLPVTSLSTASRVRRLGPLQQGTPLGPLAALNHCLIAVARPSRGLGPLPASRHLRGRGPFLFPFLGDTRRKGTWGTPCILGDTARAGDAVPCPRGCRESPRMPLSLGGTLVPSLAKDDTVHPRGEGRGRGPFPSGGRLASVGTRARTRGGAGGAGRWRRRRGACRNIIIIIKLIVMVIVISITISGVVGQVGGGGDAARVAI